MFVWLDIRIAMDQPLLCAYHFIPFSTRMSIVLILYPTLVCGVCGEQIACLFSFSDLYFYRNCAQRTTSKGTSTYESDLFDKILHFELMF